MRRRFVIETARAIALASLLWGPSVVLLQQAQVSAADVGEMEPVTAVDEGIGFLQSFWRLAWGVEFVPQRSGMILWERLGPKTWLVALGDTGADGPVVGVGVFVEAGREFLDYLAWTPQRLEETGLSNVDHYFVAGTLYGASGFQGAIVATVQEVLAPGKVPSDPPLAFQAITPFRLAVNVPAAVQEVGVLASLYHSHADNEPFSADTPQSPRRCAARWQLCRDRCWSEFIGEMLKCQVPVGACLAACGLGCIQAVWAWGLCFAICAAVCLAIEAVCLGGAHSNLKACWIGCELDRMSCDPDWEPPRPDVR